VDLIYRTLLEDEDETMAIPASLGRMLLKPLQALQVREACAGGATAGLCTAGLVHRGG
jgi:hypothetical protein